MAEKLWQKGYTLNNQIESFTVGDDYRLDQRLVKYDCQASIGHAKMLKSIGILDNKEESAIIEELNTIAVLSNQGKFTISPKEEDCHTAIENYLIRKLGKTGKKIHSYRSRNDQVVTALRLYYKDAISTIDNKLDHLIVSLFNFQKRHPDTPIPGFTHTRKAMPSSVAMWSQGILESMLDNQKILNTCFHLINQSPLGTGAGYGIPANINRGMAADFLGFTRIQQNPIYVQNSRGKFESQILNALSMILLDLNRAASDLIFFTLPEYDFFSLPEEFLTGSSIMPQKKNPDVLELLRGAYYKMVSWELQLKQQTSNLISGYHRDIQLSKEPVFKGFDTTCQCMDISILVIENLKVNETQCQKAMTPELYATQEAYNLVATGVPFREAYQKIAAKFIKKDKKKEIHKIR